MKKSVLLFTYCSFLSISLFLFSCQKEVITPNNGSAVNAKMDSSGGFDFNFDPIWDPADWSDTLGGTNPNDTLGGTNPNDSSGGFGFGFDFDPIWDPIIWGDTLTNPGDTLMGEINN